MKTGVTYVVTHFSFRSVKVGYAAGESDRLETLRKGGWIPYRLLHMATPQIAREVEQAVLFQLRHRLFAPIHLTPDMVPAGGWTETVSASVVSAEEVWRLICEEAAGLQLAPAVYSRRPVNALAVRGTRRKGDTPKYVSAARKQARIAAIQASRIPSTKKKGV